ncbi:MAG: DUF1840 family protein, partial [Saezia sp.]
PTGIIILEHIDSAILKLEQAMTLEKNKKDTGGKTSTSDQEENEEDTWHDSDITLEQRAWPFLEMLKACKKAGAVITWGV